MAISVGSVTVDIVPDTTRLAKELRAKTQNLSVDVTAHLQDKAFKAELDAATRDRTVGVRVDDHGSLDRANKRGSALLTTLALLAPAAAPLTAVAAGGAVALGGMGAAGVLAVKGISAEMKAGTYVGQQYTTQFTRLKATLATLERTAAVSVLSGFGDAAGELNKELPFLNSEVGYLARSIGSDLAPLTAGILGLFQDLSPTTHSIADGIHGLAVDFEEWATGPGGREFATYLAHELPIVAKTLASLGDAGAHVVQALAPIGGEILQGIQAISVVIAHIPVNVVQALFLAFAGYKTVQLTAAAIDAVTAATIRLGVAQKTTIGPVGPGPLGIGVSGAAALPLLGVGAASDTVTSPAQRAAQNFSAEHPGGDFSAFVKSTKTDPAAAAQLKAYMSASYKAKAATDSLGGSVDATTGSLQDEAAALKATTDKMDAAYNTARDLKSAQIGVAQAIADANTALKTNGRTLDLGTQKGRDNRTALLNLSDAVHRKIDADQAAHASQDVLNRDLTTGRGELVKMAEKFGLSRSAAIKYADSLLGIPKHLTTTVDLQIKGINGAKLSNQAKSKAIELALARANSGSTGGLMSPSGFIRRAGGGPVWGAGSATSDSIPALLSNSEFVVKAATVKQVGVPFMQAFNRQPIAAMAQALKAARAGGVAGGGVQVTNNIYEQPGQSAQATAQVVSSRLAVQLGR